MNRLICGLSVIFMCLIVLIGCQTVEREMPTGPETVTEPNVVTEIQFETEYILLDKKSETRFLGKLHVNSSDNTGIIEIVIIDDKWWTSMDHTEVVLLNHNTTFPKFATVFTKFPDDSERAMATVYRINLSQNEIRWLKESINILVSINGKDKSINLPLENILESIRNTKS